MLNRNTLKSRQASPPWLSAYSPSPETPQALFPSDQNPHFPLGSSQSLKRLRLIEFQEDSLPFLSGALKPSQSPCR